MSGTNTSVRKISLKWCSPSRVAHRADVDAGRLQRQQELRCAGVTVRFLLALCGHLAEQDGVVGAMRVGGPQLAAVDLVAAIHLHRAGARAGEVGAGVRLAHADAEGQFAGGDLRTGRTASAPRCRSARCSGRFAGRRCSARTAARRRPAFPRSPRSVRTTLRSWPPYCFGQVMPIQPRLPIARLKSR